MFNIIRLIFNFIFALLKVLRPGGAKALAAENMVQRQQLITVSRQHKQSPKLKTSDRFIYGFLMSLMNLKRLSKVSVIIKPSTLFSFHKALVKRKYRLLYSRKSTKKRGPKGPSQELIDLVLEIKRRNPRYGYLRIAMQVYHAFGHKIDPGVVRRILKNNCKPQPGSEGPSWLTFLASSKDSLWSVDLFMCQSIHLKTHWVMLVMDQFSRRIVGLSVHCGNLDGVTVCCMFNKIISGLSLSKRLSSDNDPLFRFHRWQANLRIFEIDEIKTIPYTPISHPFVERLIGTIRREYLDHVFFWNARDLQNKLNEYKDYYNAHRTHSSLDANTPAGQCAVLKEAVPIKGYRWEQHCRGLFDLPLAA